MTTQTVTGAVARRDDSAITLMWSRRKHFAAVLPASVDVEAFLGTAAGALYANDLLMEYAETSPDSLIIALMKCAALGHMPGTDEYYLTPRKDHGRGKVLGIEGYRGVVERMYRSGAVTKVVVREVCADDYFFYVEGETPKPLHELGGQGGEPTGANFFRKAGARGEMVGVYAYAEMLNNAVSRIVLATRDDVFAARDSGGYKPDDKYTPWNRMDGGDAHPEFKGRSMWWKTGAKRLEPWVPTSREYRADMLRASAAAGELASRVRVPSALPSGTPLNGNGSQAEPVDAEIVEENASGQGGKQEEPATAQQVNAEFKRLGFTVRNVSEVLSSAAAIAGRSRPVKTLADFDPGELTVVRDRLAECAEHGDVVALLARIAESRGDARPSDRPSGAPSASGSEGATPDRQPPAPGQNARSEQRSSPGTDAGRDRQQHLGQHNADSRDA